MLGSPCFVFIKMCISYLYLVHQEYIYIYIYISKFISLIYEQFVEFGCLVICQAKLHICRDILSFCIHITLTISHPNKRYRAIWRTIIYYAFNMTGEPAKNQPNPKINQKCTMILIGMPSATQLKLRNQISLCTWNM